MEMKYVLLEYDYTTYCQGTADRNHGMSLIHCPKSYDFFEVRDALMQARHVDGDYEINEKSVTNATIEC
jgi:hypothetical protein